MNILIVESRAKSKTIQKYLGSDWKVHACGGHVQELPSTGKQGRKAFWANRTGELPAPGWEWTSNGEKALRAIRADADKHGVTDFYLAPDPDREGEFIAWRLAELLAPHGTTHRVTFQEVTPEALAAAIAAPRPVDMDLVHSALVRKYLDRLVGFRTSKFAKSILPGRQSTSMGRVQTPALGFVVDRELEREAHVPIPYFEVRAVAAGISLQARFHEPDSPEAWRDNAGKVHPTRTSDEPLAKDTVGALESAGRVAISQARRSSKKSSPRPPFSTDALLRAAGSRWSWSPRKTSKLASMLYEAGHITYIRTDSNRLAASAISAAREVIEGRWGADHLGAGAVGKPTSGKVQDAHEAIRPTRLAVALPEGLEPDVQRLYKLIRAQVLGSQMSAARYERIHLRAAADGSTVPLTGTVSWRVHAGWEAAFEGIDKAPVVEPPSVSLEVGDVLPLDTAEQDTSNPVLVRDATRPPPRLRAHTLIQRMKQSGIGRPSTYASTVEKLEKRSYLTIDKGSLVPTDRGRAVWLDIAPFYADDADHADLFDTDYTAELEELLDDVEAGLADAPQAWETARDRIRALHNMALERRKSGAVTPKLLQRLTGLVVNAPDGFARPDDLTALTQEQALALREQLVGLGVVAAPSERQQGYIAKLVELVGLTEKQAADLVGLDSLEAIGTVTQASALIEELKSRLPDDKPASTKQLGFVRSLAKKAKLDEAAACALVELERFDQLTGGREGSASRLIEALQGKVRKGRA